jgi:5'-deoxynucleotidase YfbR-like HD superfamily hydrolase
MGSKLDNLLKFVELTHKFQAIKRVIFVKGEDRNENDLEHSAQLALIAWYLITKDKLRLDLELTLKYALAHDLVEVYAGDTFFYDTKGTKSKLSRERKAAQTLARKFPEFTDLHKLIQKYEEKKDPESLFIYALDKIVPVMNIYLDSGRSWKRDNITLEMLVDGKTEKVKVSTDIAGYFDSLVKKLKAQENILFPRDNNK